jgi:hypothetical protein
MALGGKSLVVKFVGILCQSLTFFATWKAGKFPNSIFGASPSRTVNISTEFLVAQGTKIREKAEIFIDSSCS